MAYAGYAIGQTFACGISVYARFVHICAVAYGKTGRIVFVVCCKYDDGTYDYRYDGATSNPGEICVAIKSKIQ